MKHEFKVTRSKDQTVYTLESATGGSTSAGNVGSVDSELGGVQRRNPPGDNILAQEQNVDEGKGLAGDLSGFLKAHGFKGPYRLGKLPKWAADLSEFDKDNLIMVQGNDVEYDEFVLDTGFGELYMGGEGGITRMTEKAIMNSIATVSENSSKKEEPKPRNFVAKNAKMGGAGQHKDKKKAAKQGDVKHKKPLAESYAEDLAKQVFSANPNIKDENAVLDAAWPIAVKDLGNKRAMSVFNYDEDFPSDLVSVYGWLQKGTSEGVSDLSYDAQSLITKLRRDVEEKRLQPTPQAVLAAARELAGDMDFAPQLLVKQVLGQGMAEGSDDKFSVADKVEDLVDQYRLYDKRGWTDYFTNIAGRKLEVAEIRREMEYASKFLQLLDSIRMRSDYRGQQDPRSDQELIDLSNQWLSLFNKATGEFKGMSGQGVAEEWSQKYKSSINCSHPKGFSQKAHCAGKKKHEESMMTMEAVCPDCGMCETHGNVMEIKKGQKDANGFTRCWPGKHAVGTKKSATTGKQVRNCVPNEGVEDHEIKMASSELQSIAKNAVHLLDLVRKYSEQDGLQAWQQSKITKAADYLNSVLQSVSGEQSGMEETRNNYHANTTGFSRGSRDPEGQNLQSNQQVWGLKINGKVWSKDGKDVTFTSKEAALNSRNSILKNRPDLEIGLVTKGGMPEDAYMESLTNMLERSVSQAQHNLMVGVAHNPSFAQKVKVKQKVGQEFARADQGHDISKLPIRVPKKNENTRTS